MATIVDIVGAMIIRGAIVLAMLNINLSLHNALYSKTAQSVVAQNLLVVSDIVRSDLRLAAFNVAGSVFTQADTSQVIFKGDIDNSGTAETINFYLGGSTTVNGKTHWKLYRVVDSGTPLVVGTDIITFKLTYYDAAGNVTAVLNNIRSIKVSIAIESNVSFQGWYPMSSWERQIFPVNLNIS